MILEHKNGYKTYYEEYGGGNKQTLVLLHGIGADNNMWQLQKETYANKGFHIIVPDLLAHGSSSNVESLSLGDWENQLDDLFNHLGVEKVTLIGVSMGGVIAQYYAVANRSRVENLIISDSFGELKTITEKLLGFSQVLGFRIFRVLGNKLLAKGMSSTYKADYAKKARDYFSEVSSVVDLSQMILARKAINQINILESLSHVEAKSMVMVGKEFGKQFIDINRKIADALGVELITLEKAMDPSNLVNPEAFDE